MDMTATPGDVLSVRGVAAFWVRARVDGGTTLILAHTVHSELVWDASVVQAPSIFRKEANSFLHIHTLVLIGSLLPEF